jgi:hypothetical protein
MLPNDLPMIAARESGEISVEVWTNECGLPVLSRRQSMRRRSNKTASVRHAADGIAGVADDS